MMVFRRGRLDGLDSSFYDLAWRVGATCGSGRLSGHGRVRSQPVSPGITDSQDLTLRPLTEAFERGPFVVPPDLAYGRGSDEDEGVGVFHFPDEFRQPLVCRRRDDELVAFQFIHSAK